MVEPRDITARLLDRAKEDRQCAENNKAVFDAFSEQMRRFESREGHNVYAVRMAVDHKNGMERDTRYAADLEEAAAELTRLRAEVERLTRERADAMGRAAQIADMQSDELTSHARDLRYCETDRRFYAACAGRLHDVARAIRAEASKKGGEG